MTASSPKRLFVYFTHYGCLTDKWFPKLSHGALSKADYMAMPTLAPMAPFAEKLLMVRGIRAMNEWGFEGNYGQKNDPHTQVVGTYFTCHPVTPNNPGASGASNPGKFDCKPTGRSLDHIAAEQVNPKGQAPLLLQIGGVQGSDSNTMSVISWDQPMRIFPGQGSPMPVFSQLTGLFQTGQPMNMDTYKVVRGKSVIDCVRSDLKRLQGINMSGSDKKLLQDWVDLLHYNSSGGAVAAMCSMDSASKLNLTADTVKAASATGTGGDIEKTTNVMMDLAVLTALCDNNRIIFMKHPGNYTFKNLSLTMESHSISHRIGNAGQGGACVANALDMIWTIDKYYAKSFAYLVGRIDMFPDGDGKTMLDNSAAIWFQEMSDGNSHNLNNMPILQAGSMGGYFKTGWAINVDGGKADMSPGHSSEDCKNGQSPFNMLDSVGTPPDVASKPINKYYCNLLNGLGVKAGDDGWPAKGGTKTVTNFGKYDDTLLFRDGGTAAAIIKNPGEYPELRAG